MASRHQEAARETASDAPGPRHCPQLERDIASYGIVWHDIKHDHAPAWLLKLKPGMSCLNGKAQRAGGMNGGISRPQNSIEIFGV